jgi:uncharacterized protein YcbK (DUF882 family)
MTEPDAHARRRFLRRGLQLAGALATLPAGVRAALPARGERALALVHTHTQERIEIVYAEGERYLAQGLAALNTFLRDHYTGEVGVIEPRLLDLLHGLRRTLGNDRPYEVISGYRCPATNERLRTARSGSGVASQSLHTRGCAIDVRLPGTALADLRDAALGLASGGVGYYPGSRFVHVDTGRVRRW